MTELGPLYQKAKEGQLKWEEATLVMQRDIICALVGSNLIWIVPRGSSKDFIKLE